MELDLNNAEVLHQSYGTGKIVSVKKNYVEVQFDGREKKTLFQYPACFDKFLRLQNQELQDKITPLVEQWRAAHGADDHEKLKLQHEKTCKAIMNRKRLAEEKKLLSAKRTTSYRLNSLNRNSSGRKEEENGAG